MLISPAAHYVLKLIKNFFEESLKKTMTLKPFAYHHTGAQPESRNGGGGLFWGSGGEAPSARKYCIFLQNELNFGAILTKNNAFKTWHRNWQRNMIQLIALMGCMGSG